jgi:hypothetical protein
MSVAANVADSIVSELNAATLSIWLKAERHYVPSFELKDMDELRVSVVPKGAVITKCDRNRNYHDVLVDVAVQKKFSSGSLEEIDPLLQLVEEISDFFRLRRLVSFPAAHWIRTEHSPLYSQEHWDELRQFTSVLTFTFRLIR